MAENSLRRWFGMLAFQSVSRRGLGYAGYFRRLCTKVIRRIARKRVALVREGVQNLELLVRERRAHLEEVSRNCWASSHAEAALVEAETSLAVRRKYLLHLLQTSS
ncbi:MAG TPA: hypothetical protein VMF58_18890 [Rhizomicrobium sp.]|nr:hypothetical protein [Rhizomicrobium sp.]